MHLCRVMQEVHNNQKPSGRLRWSPPRSAMDGMELVFSAPQNISRFLPLALSSSVAHSFGNVGRVGWKGGEGRCSPQSVVELEILEESWVNLVGKSALGQSLQHL